MERFLPPGDAESSSEGSLPTQPLSALPTLSSLTSHSTLSSRKRPSAGVVVGAVIGGLTCLASIIGAFLCYHRRSARQKATDEQSSESDYTRTWERATDTTTFSESTATYETTSYDGSCIVCISTRRDATSKAPPLLALPDSVSATTTMLTSHKDIRGPPAPPVAERRHTEFIRQHKSPPGPSRRSHSAMLRVQNNPTPSLASTSLPAYSELSTARARRMG